MHKKSNYAMAHNLVQKDEFSFVLIYTAEILDILYSDILSSARGGLFYESSVYFMLLFYRFSIVITIPIFHVKMEIMNKLLAHHQ